MLGNGSQRSFRSSGKTEQNHTTTEKGFEAAVDTDFEKVIYIQSILDRAANQSAIVAGSYALRCCTEEEPKTVVCPVAAQSKHRCCEHGETVCFLVIGMAITIRQGE